MSNDQTSNSAESSSALEKETIEALLDSIKTALEQDPDCNEAFINEFDDFTLAVPLSGGQNALDNFMEKQKLKQYLADTAESIASRMTKEKDRSLTCCFTGHRPKRIPWLADSEDYRTLRLKETLESLINGLSIYGVDRYITGNAKGFDTIAAEAVLDSNDYLKTSKMWDGVPKEWQPAKLEIAIPFEGHNGGDPRIENLQKQASIAHVVSSQSSHTHAFRERNEYMVDNADIVVAFFDNREQDTNVEKSGTFNTISYAKKQLKTIILLNPEWVEDDWPSVLGIRILQPVWRKNNQSAITVN